MKEYIFKNMSTKDIFPFVEFEIRIKAENDKDAWNKLLRIVQEVDIQHCALTNSDKN